MQKYEDMYQVSKDFQEEAHLHYKRSDPKYQEHYELKSLITDKDREDIEYYLASRKDVYPSPNEHDPDMNLTQPRNTNIVNYNHEQYPVFTAIHKEQMEIDRQRKYEMKRILKYIKENPNKNLAKSWKRKLFYGQKADNLNIDRFVDDSVDIEGYKPPVSRRAKRKVILTKSSRDLTNYSAWKSYDRDILVPFYNRTPTSVIKLSPKLMRHVFGDPDWNPSSTSSGIYKFEDSNLDCFVVAEPHRTTATRGVNKSPEFYENERQTKPSGRREKPWHEFEEFWNSEDEYDFFIFSDNYAEYRKFKAWIRREIARNKDKPSIKERVQQKYGDLFQCFDDYDVDYSDYNERGAENMGIFNFSWVDHLDKKERKELKNEIPPLPTPAEFLPFDIAEKMDLSKEELEALYQEMKEADKNAIK